MKEIEKEREGRTFLKKKKNTCEKEKARLIYKRSSSGWTEDPFFFIIV